VSFQTIIHHLSEPVDVYSDWIDECQKVNAVRDDDGDDGGHQNEADNDSDADPEDQRHGLQRSDDDEVSGHRHGHGHGANGGHFGDTVDSEEDGQALDGPQHYQSEEDGDAGDDDPNQGQRRLLRRNDDDGDDESDEGFFDQKEAPRAVEYQSDDEPADYGQPMQSEHDGDANYTDSLRRQQMETPQYGADGGGGGGYEPPHDEYGQQQQGHAEYAEQDQQQMAQRTMSQEY